MSRRSKPSAWRFAITAAGCGLIGVGVAGVLDARLGADPYTLFIDGLANMFKLHIGAALLLAGAAMSLLAWALGRRPSWGLLMTVGAVAVVVAIFQGRLREPSGTAQQVGLMIVGVVAIGVGVGTYRAAGWAEGPLDSLPQALADRVGHATLMFAIVQLCLLILGWVMGGRVGIGTVIAVAVLGPVALRSEQLVRSKLAV